MQREWDPGLGARCLAVAVQPDSCVTRRHASQRHASRYPVHVNVSRTNVPGLIVPRPPDAQVIAARALVIRRQRRRVAAPHCRRQFPRLHLLCMVCMHAVCVWAGGGGGGDHVTNRSILYKRGDLGMWQSSNIPARRLLSIFAREKLDSTRFSPSNMSAAWMMPPSLPMRSR